MNKYVYIICLCSILVCLGSCGEKEPQLCTLYGSVNDKVTGEPLANVNVVLVESAESTTTGSDGVFMFNNMEEGTYTLQFTKIGYENLTKEGIVVKGGDKNKPVDIQMEKLPPSLTVVDDNRKEIDSVDFGSDYNITMRSFNILNNSDNKLKWKIACDKKWIEFSVTEGQLKPNEIFSVIVRIDRYSLDMGSNIAIANITSDNGSKDLKFIATGVTVIDTKEATNIDSHSAVLNANVIHDMQPPIKEYGFVYSTIAAPTLINGAQKKSNLGTPKIGDFSLLVEGLEINTRYYACAFVSNGGEPIYGKQIDFITISSQIPQISLINTVQIKSTATTITGIWCRVDDNGGLPIEGIYICWGKEHLPQINQNSIKVGENNQSTSGTITDLEPNTTYYIRAYTKNSKEEAYSKEYEISTMAGTPKVETNRDYDTGYDYIVVSGKTNSPDNILIVRQGICYSTTNSKPDINNDETKEAENNSESSFTCRITGLKGCTTYYCRAFAENQYGEIGYSKDIVAPKTNCQSSRLYGYVYDQDGMPVQGVKVGIYDDYREDYAEKYDHMSIMTDINGFYEITFNSTGKWKILATKDGYTQQVKTVTINQEQTHQLDFNISIENYFSVDVGTGIYNPMGTFWVMIFSCYQSGLSGQTTSKTLRIKNHRNKTVNWNISNIPTTGIQFSTNSGVINANSEISIIVTFTYPSATSLPVEITCSSGTITYLWNWDGGVYSNYYMNYNGQHYEMYEDYCCACCVCSPLITVDDQAEAFDIFFNQFAVFN